MDECRLIKCTTLTEIADAIRGKCGTTEPIRACDFADQIAAITGGGGADTEEIDDLLDEINGEFIAEAQYTFTFIGANGEILCEVPVYETQDCDDPITSGIIQKPTKESTPQYSYAYSHWSATEGGTADSSIFQNVTEDRKVYAVFNESLRFYTITFYDGDSVVHTLIAPYGNIPSYALNDKVGWRFEGWEPEVVTVAGDASYYAQWKELNRLEDYTWSELSTMAKDGTAEGLFSIGDTKTFTMGSKTMTAELVSFNNPLDRCDGYTDTSNNPGMAFVMINAYEDAIKMDTEGDAAIYKNTTLFAHIATLINEVEEELRQVIVPVEKYSNTGTNGTAGLGVQYLWIPHYIQLNTGEYTDPTLSHFVNIYSHFAKTSVAEIYEARKRKSYDGSKYITYWLDDANDQGILQYTYHGGVVYDTGSAILAYKTGAPRQTSTQALILGFCI